MKKALGISVVIVLVMTVLFSGCKKGSASEEKVTLRYTSLSEGANGDPAIAKIVEHAAEKNNVNIEFEPVPGATWAEFLQRLMAQIAANDVPDVIRIRTGDITFLADNNFVVDLGPRIAKLSADDYYLEYFMYFGGKQVMVPPGIYTHNLWYNKDMFAAAGIPEPKGYDNPWTFDEFRAVAKALTSGSGSEKRYGYATAFDGGRWCTFIWGNGAEFHDANAKPTFNTPQFKEAFQYLTDLILVDESVPSPSAAQAIGPRDLFLSGRVAMISTGQWDVVNWNKITDFKVGVAAPPYNPKNPGAASTASLFIDGYCIMSGSKYQDKSWDAILSFIDEVGCGHQTTGGVFGWPINKKFAEANRDSLFAPSIARDQVDTLMGFGGQRRAWGFLVDETAQAFIRYFQLMALGEMSVNDALETLQSETLSMRINPIGLNLR